MGKLRWHARRTVFPARPRPLRHCALCHRGAGAMVLPANLDTLVCYQGAEDCWLRFGGDGHRRCMHVASDRGTRSRPAAPAAASPRASAGCPGARHAAGQRLLLAQHDGPVLLQQQARRPLVEDARNAAARGGGSGLSWGSGVGLQRRPRQPRCRGAVFSPFPGHPLQHGQGQAHPGE